MKFVTLILDLLYSVVKGLYSIVCFVLELIETCYDLFSVLPSSVSSMILSVFTIGFVIIIYKALKS